MKILLSLIVFVVLFVVFLRYLEQTSIFYPSRSFAATPKILGLPYEDVYVTTQDQVKVHGWLIKNPAAKSTVIFFHGNAGNIGDRLGKISLFHGVGLNVFIIDYRGYGNSEGKPTEKGVFSDALAAYDYIARREDLSDQNIIGYGASLGGAVAVDLAAQRKLSGLIIDSSFSSAADMAKSIYPFLPSFLFKTKFDSVNKIAKVAAPKLFIHSKNDEIVPYPLGKKLYDAAPQPKVFIDIIGGHNDGHIQDQKKIEQGISTFLREFHLI